MFFRLLGLCCLSVALGAQAPEINEGVALFKQGKYADAVTAFQKAVAAYPQNATAHLYLGTAYMSQFVPGQTTPQNVDLAVQAENEFRTVLNLDSGNLIALRSLASLAYNRSTANSPDNQARYLAEATDWNNRILSLQPDDKNAHYTLGVIAWMKSYRPRMEARQRLGMRPQDPGPISDASLRASLRNTNAPVITEGIRHLERVLELDPKADDAMAYLNLLYREQADLQETADDYKRDTVKADELVHQALETKRAKAKDGSSAPGMVPAPPPPPPPPAGGVAGGVIRPAIVNGDPAPNMPSRIRVGGNVQAAKLIHAPAPVYPPLAVQARIQGIVRFNAVIARDGTVRHVDLVSGHPLLIPNATEAVQQYRYQPTLLNGVPVEVVTQVDVPFTL